MVQWKKVGTTALALSLSLGLMTSPIHADSKNSNKGKQEQKNKNYKFFADEHEAQWAINAIIKMATKKVFIGDEYGYFNPNKPITRAEAAVAAVRLMGLENKVNALGEVQLNFKDAKEIDKQFHWAEKYIYVGLENGLFDAGMSSFQAGAPASREWVATILVRALGLTSEANAKMNTKLQFKDSKAISASAVGYVAVAVEKGLVTGYTDGTFQPNKAITRAEMAALLDRMDWIYDSEYSGVKGSVYSVSGDLVQIKRANGEIVNVRIQSNTYIMLNGSMVTKDQIQAGQQATVVFNDNKETMLIDLKGEGAPVVQDWINGTVGALSLPSGSTTGILQVNVNNQVTSFYLNNKTKVYAEGLELQLADLSVGQNVSFLQKDNFIVEVKVAGVVKQESGVLKQIIKPSNNQIGMLVLSTTKGEVVLPLSSNVRYIYNNKEISLDNLAMGSIIEVTTLDEFIKRVKVTQVNITDYSGTIKTLVMPTSTKLGQIEILYGKESKTFYLTANTTIHSGDLALSLSDLSLAQKITVKVENEFLKDISVEGKVATYDGKVTGINYPTAKNAGSITFVKGGISNTLAFATNMNVTFNDKAVDLKTVIVGDVVNLTTFNSKVKVLDVKEKNNESVFDYSGTITKLVLPTTNQAGLLELRVSKDNVKTFILANTVIKSGGLQLHVSDLALNQNVSVKADKDVLKEINVVGKVEAITGKVIIVQAATSNQAGTVTIESNGRLYSYLFAPEYAVTQNDKAVEFGNIEVGDVVQLSTFNSHIKVVDIKEKNKDAAFNTYAGTLVGFNLPADNNPGSISVLTQNNQLVNLALHKDVKVYNNNNVQINLADLTVLSTVEVEVNASLVTKISVK